MQKNEIFFFKSLVNKLFYDPHIIFNVLKQNLDNHHARPADGQLIIHYKR